MKPLIALLLVSCCCIGTEPEPAPPGGGLPAITTPSVPPIEPPETPAPAGTEESDTAETSPFSSSSPRTSDFQRDEIGLVLRVLARQAGVSVYVDDSVTGTVTLRIDNKTPRETLEAICAVKDLVMEDQKGVLAIRSRNPPPPGGGLLKMAVVLCGLLALVGWFAAGMLFQRLRSAGKPGSL